MERGMRVGEIVNSFANLRRFAIPPVRLHSWR